MKRRIFTLFLCFVTTFAFSQTTYYWVGGTGPISLTANSNWNTKLDGTGDARAAADANDVLIFDGSNVGGTTPTTGPVVCQTSGTAMGSITLQNAADITFTRTSNGTSTITVGDSPFGDDFVVNAGCTFRFAGNQGSVLILLKNNATNNNVVPATTSATGRIDGAVVFEEGSSTAQNRFTSRLKNSLVFTSGSSLTTKAAYAFYAFGSTGSSTTPIANGVVFESGASYFHEGGLSPFGSNSTSFLVDFKPGSNFHFKAAPATNMFSNRKYGNVFVQNNTTITADGSLARIENLTIDAGSTFVTHTSGVTPVNGNIVNNGNLRVPAANPDRNNKLLLIGAAAQTISGSGTFQLSDFVVSDVSNVSFSQPITVDSATVIIGDFNGNINGPGTFTVKSNATHSVTGTTNVDSFLVKNISDFTGIEIGMSVTGTGIPAGTVVANTSSSAGTITLSRAATAGNYTGSVSLTIFNGDGAVLPIKFSQVSAALQNTAAMVTWQVADESNIAKYIVERQKANGHFEQIGTVAAGKLFKYSFTDNNMMAGVNLYRVKAQSVDGQVRYSSIVKVSNSKEGIKLQLFPNPATNVISVTGLRGNDQVNIVDHQGRVVMTMQNKNAYTTSTFDVSALAAGNYMLVVKGMDQSKTISFIKR